MSARSISPTGRVRRSPGWIRRLRAAGTVHFERRHVMLFVEYAAMVVNALGKYILFFIDEVTC
jgi:hypothetical protein